MKEKKDVLPRVVKLGVIEFHSEDVNPGLMKRFYAVTEDLRASGSIVDLWLMDIATVLAEFGYDMTVQTKKPKPTPCYMAETISNEDNPRAALIARIEAALKTPDYSLLAGRIPLHGDTARQVVDQIADLIVEMTPEQRT